MISPYQQAQLNTLAERYSREMFRSVDEALKKYDRSGKTRASLKVTWLKSTDRQPPRILLIFERQAALFETRRMSWIKIPNIDQLTEWSEGVNFSGKVPGYKNGLAPDLPPWKAKQRIVWAIARDKRKNDTWKRKPWRRIALSDVLKELNRATLQAYKKEVEDTLAESLSTGTS
jgi:hypothetical protein